MALRLRIEGTTFRDSKNREVTLHGINAAGDAKFPCRPDQPSHIQKDFFDGDNVSFVGRPFAVDEAPVHFARLRRWGYNTIRYIFTWEAVEAAGPGIYDEDWIQHTISVLRKAKEFDFHVFMDPHQDVWSRFTGGSGAPMWTLYACGLNPETFAATEAALIQNTWPKPEEFPKMIWATNYCRLACQAVFTMFFGGRDFAPKAIIDGVNIQDYLQNHFIAACQHLAVRIREAGDLDGDLIIGWESINEPNRGLIGWPDISKIPSEQKLQKGTSPTAWQAILTGSGRSCEIDTWEFGRMGPYKSGSVLVDPHGQMAWLHAYYDESRYGWKRDPGWKLGECVWAQHGIWDPSSDGLLRKDYFSRDPNTGIEIDYEYFTNHYYMGYYRKYSSAMRTVFPGTIMFCQPPVLEIPPTLMGTEDDDPNMVFAPHFYDGITLMTKKWNRLWNVDVFGILRGKYLTPAFAIKIGESAIRNCFRDSLKAIKKEGLDHMGLHPCVFTEIGIPYDMNDQAAYKTGDYSSQIRAMDANHFALEGSKSCYTLWNYTATNDHYWGDQWNGEDLSIFSRDDRILTTAPFHRSRFSSTFERTSHSYYDSHIASMADASPSSFKEMMMAERVPLAKYTDSMCYDDNKWSNFRAAEAYVRPTPVATHGDIVSYGFDLRNCEFKFALYAPSTTSEDAPTEIFLPEYHFPPEHVIVKVSGGKWTIGMEQKGNVHIQKLKWWHAEGNQTLSVRCVTTRQDITPGWLKGVLYIDRLWQCRENGCLIM